MREILFRGKRLDNGEWVYGVYHYEHGFGNPSHYIVEYSTFGAFPINNLIKVEPETVGQYTGLKDKYDSKIFEGDVLVRVYHDGSFNEEHNIVVEFTTESITNCGCCNDVIAYGYDLSDFAYAENTLIIGNIYDETTEGIE